MTTATKKKPKKTSTALVPAAGAKLPSVEAVAEKLPSVLRSMYKEMQQEMATIDTLTGKANYEVIKHSYAVGEMVRKARDNANKYGEGAVVNLAEALSVGRAKAVDSNQLTQWGNVVTVYPWSYMEKLLGRAQKANVQLAWNHFAQGLATLRKKSYESARKKFEHEMIDEALSVQELLSRTREFRRKKGEAGGPGRPPVPPKSPGAACRQIIKYKKEIDNRVSGWDSSLFEWVAEADANQCTDELLEDLGETAAGVAEVRGTFDDVLGKLEKAMKRVQKVLGRKGELAEARAADSKSKPKSKVVESEDIDVEPDAEEDDGIEIEAKAPKKVHESNGHGKPLSVAEKIAAAKKKAKSK
jgi:hypothetical protein